MPPHAAPSDYDAKAMLAAIVQSSDDAIISKTRDGTITSWNAAAEAMFGYTAEEIVGNSVAILFPEDIPENEEQLLDSIFSGGHINHYETVRLRKDGTPINVSLTLSPIKDEQGNIIGASKIVRNITERKRAEFALTEAQTRLKEHAQQLERIVAERTEKLQETISVLDDFCHTIAHDLRAPLRALTGFSKDLLETQQNGLDKEGREMLQRISQAACRMDLLILDLLRLGRISTQDLAMERISVESVVRDAQAILEADFCRSRAQLRIVHPLHDVHGNIVLLGQVFTNLLGNAIKFVPPEKTPEIRIASAVHGGMVRICVEDNGIGIRPGQAHKLFQPFLRLVKDDQFPGTGVGLAIVRKAAERMGGRVGVESELGRGSCFWVELPAARAEAPAE